MDDKVIEQIKARTEQVTKGEAHSSSLLAQIRRKELEISGKVLEAKKQAERVVADARKKAAVIVQQADEEGLKRAQEHYDGQMSEASAQAKEIEGATSLKVAEIEERTEKRLEEAVSYIVNTITPVSE